MRNPGGGAFVSSSVGSELEQGCQQLYCVAAETRSIEKKKKKKEAYK
jgi:hypothetical protein